MDGWIEKKIHGTTDRPTERMMDRRMDWMIDT